MEEEELEEKLKTYFEKGYKWRAYFDNYAPDDFKFQIWTPKYFVESTDVIKYFSSIKRLEIGKKEHIEMKECLDLIKLLLTAGHKYILDDPDSKSPLLDSDIFKHY